MVYGPIILYLVHCGLCGVGAGYSTVSILVFHKTLRELDLRARYVLVLWLSSGHDIIVLGANDAVEPGDKLVAIGQDEMLDRLQHMNEDDQ